MEIDTVSALEPGISFEVENVTAFKEIAFEEESIIGCAHESTLEVPWLDAVSALESDVCYEDESVSAVKQIAFEEEKITGCAYESTLEVETVSALEPDVSYKMEKVTRSPSKRRQ